MNNYKSSAYLAIIITITVWGVSLVNAKIALTYFTPISLAFWRFFVASIVLFVIHKMKHPQVRIALEDRKIFFIAGSTGIFLYYIFQNTGLMYASTAIVSIILSMIPMFTMLVENWIEKRPFTPLKIASVFLSIIGVILVVGFQVEESLAATLLGSFLIFLCAISWLIYTFSTKKLYEKYSPLTITYYQIIIGTFLLGLLMPFNWANPLAAPLEPLLHTLYLGIVCSAMALLFYAYALKHLSATVCNIFINLMPGVTIVTSYFYLNETITWIQLLGALLILSSIFIITSLKEPSFKNAAISPNEV